MATYNNIIHTVETLKNLFTEFDGRFNMEVELCDKDMRAFGVRSRKSGSIVAIGYRPSMAVAPNQGLAFGQYFGSDLVKVNFEGVEYHLPDCEDFAKWVQMVDKMVRTFAEQDVWSL